MRRLDQQTKHRVKLWLEQDGCPVTDTTAAIAARKRAKLLGKDQGRSDEHTVSGTLSGCLFTNVQEMCDSKGHKPAGKQVSKSSAAVNDPLWIFQPDAPTAIQGSSHLISLSNKRYKLLQSTDCTQQPAGTSSHQQQEGATLGSSWAKLQEHLQDAGAAAVAELSGFGDLVGHRVSVWWPDDKQYYHGLITDYYCHNSSNSSSAFDSSRSSPDPPEVAPPAAAAADQASTRGPGRRSKHASAAASKGKDTVLPQKHHGPGRPPKSARSEGTAPTDAAAAVSSDKMQKRGPGRPPKKLAVAAGSLAARGAGGIKVKKRGPGRPPKSTTASLSAAATGSGITGSGGSVEKRGPGRPPKPAAAAAAAKSAAAAPAAGDDGGGSKKRGRPPKPRGEIVWGKHRIEYDDGEVELLDLSRETWHLTDDDMTAIKTQAKQQQASSRSRSKDVPLPAVGDDLITFAVDRPAVVGPLMAAKPNSTAVTAAAAANRCARGGRVTKRKDAESASSSDSSGSEGDSSSAESGSDESSSGDDSSSSEPDRDDSDADSDAADAEDSQGGDQQEKLLKRKCEAVADPAGSGGKRSKAAATAAAIAAAAAGSVGTPAESSKHIASPAEDTAAAVAAQAHQDSKDVAPTDTAAAGATNSTAKTPNSAPTPTTSGAAQPATAAADRTAATASSKPQQSAFLGVLSAGFRKFMVSGGSKAPAAAAANNASRASLQAATAAAAAAAVSRAVAARTGCTSVTLFKPTDRATSISHQPRTKAADKSEAATGPAGTAAAARDATVVAGMKAISPVLKDGPAAAAAAASEVRTKMPSHSHSPPPHPAAPTFSAADKARVNCTVSSSPAAAAAGLSTAVSMDLPTSAAAASTAAAGGGGATVQHNSSSTAELPIDPPAADNDAARDSMAAVTGTKNPAAAADMAAAAAPVPPESEIAQHDHQASRGISAAAAFTQAVVMDCWQRVPVLKAEAETAVRTPGAAEPAAVADIDGEAGRVWPGAADFDGGAAAAIAAAATDVAAITPARELLDELTARLGQMGTAAAAAGSSSGSNTTKAPMQMQMLVAKDNMQFSLLTEQLTAGNRGHISSAGAAAEYGSNTAATSKDSSCLAVLLVKLPAGFDRTSVAVQSSTRGLEVCYKAAERSSSEAARPAAGAAAQNCNMDNMTVKECTHVVHLPSDLAWVKVSNPSHAHDCGDGASVEPAAVEEAAAAPSNMAAEVVGLLQYSSTWGKLMVLGKCCRI